MNGALLTVDDRCVLRFERLLSHPVEKVWRALTDPSELTSWFPSDVEMELAPGARIRFVFRDGEGPPLDGEITELDPPRVFAYTWGDALLRWELAPEGGATRLVFTHTFEDRAGAASFAAGWHGCLDALELMLDGRPVDLPQRWADRHESYVEAFGLADGEVREGPDGWTVRFERQLTRPADEVWAALSSDSADARVGGPAPEGFTNGFVPAGDVTAVQAPTLLEYRWESRANGHGRVRWELRPGNGGARLVLTQSGPADLADQRLNALAGWHTHLELLAETLLARAHSPEKRVEELRRRYGCALR
jgi:uncharacterized protein YndB with AHSA1/START domain